MATGSLYGSSSESTGLYGIGAASGGTYFEWFIFYDSATAPATPTGGSWSFTTNTGTAPSGWLNAPPASPTNLVWVSIAVVDSRSTSTLTWSAPGLMTGSGLPILTGSGVPSSGTGLNGQLYVNTATTPQSMYLKETGSWVQITGSNLVDLVNNQTIGGVKTFSSTIVGDISGTAGNVSGTVAIANGGTGGTTAAGARTNLGLGTISTQDASSVSITGGSITGITDLAIADGGTGASTAANARTNLGAVGLTDAQTLTNKTISGASNTLTDIGNSSLSNSTVTVNGSSIALGSSATVTASTPNNLVFGSQLSANASFNGSQQVNVNLLSVSTPGTYGTSNVVPVFTLNSYGQITSVSPQTITIDTTDISGTIGIAQGGTGANTVTAARVNLLPSYTGNGGKLLALNAGATDLEWKAVSGIGTVTSVDVSGGTTGLTTYGGPITAAGTVTLAGTLAIANGGTGATTASTARTSLGAVGLTDAQTLTNKTLTSPIINEILDANSNEILGFSPTASATDYVTVKNGIGVGVPLHIYADGPSTNIGLHLQPKGTGLITISDGTDFDKGIRFRSSGSSASTITLLDAVSTAGRVITLPDATTTLVGRNTTDTLTNKTISLSSNTITGTLATTNGGTGLTSFTANGVVYASSTSALATGSALTWNGSNTFTVIPATGTAYNRTESTQYSTWLQAGAGNANVFWEFSAGTPLRWVDTSAGELMRLTSTGLGIGTSSVAYKLQVASGATAATSYFSSTATPAYSATAYNGGNARIAMVGGGASGATTGINFSQGGSFEAYFGGVQESGGAAAFVWQGYNGSAYAERMRLDSSGNLGIGTSSPAAKLDVVGFGNFGSSTTAGQVTVNAVTGAGTQINWKTNGTQLFALGTNVGLGGIGDFSLYDYANATTAFVIRNGNLGLGVTPSAWSGLTALQVSGTAALYGTNSVTGLSFNQYYNGTNNIYLRSDFSNRFQMDSGAFKFYTAASGNAGDPITFTQAMTLTAGGKLLVGTTTDYGSKAVISAANGTAYSSTTQLRISGGNTNNNRAAILFSDDALQDGKISYYPAATAAASYFSFSARSTESDMILDGSGNLGLGVTPSAWYTSYGTKAFQFAASGSLQGLDVSSSDRRVTLANNDFINTSGNNTYINTGHATKYQQASGQHTWFNAPSGTAGDPITFTQAMTLDASGRLLLGATSVTNGTAFGGSGQVNMVKVESSGYPCLQINTNSGGGSSLQFTNGNTVNGVVGYNASGGTNEFTINNALSGTLVFGTNNTERARIDLSGNLLVGTTTNGKITLFGSGFSEAGAAGIDIQHISGSVTGDYYQSFQYGGSVIGSITQSGTTAVLFNVTSDQRLKENIVDAPEFGSVIDSIKVRSYDWKADGTHQRAGFVAQELVTVAPEAVHQPADPEQMMAVDYSKLVPMLVKEIQDLRKRLADAGIA